MKRSYCLLAIGCWLLPSFVAAQDPAATEVGARDEREGPIRPWWVGVWTGAAKHAPFATRHGERHRDYYMTGLRIGRTMHSSRRLAFDYFVDLVPWVRSTNNPVRYTSEEACAPWEGLYQCRQYETMETATTRGYAVTPIGLQMRALRGGPVEIVVGASFGAVMYDQRIPDPGEKRLNFMGDVTLGVQVPMELGVTLLAGVRQNHTSNANTGDANPGLEARVLYVGVTRSVGRSQP